MPLSSYRGRFAPSPTGSLHFGSLVAAVGSFLDAKQHNGSWLVRIEDLDQPRCVIGAADDILRTLEAFGLYWDETVIYQSTRTGAYAAALHQLQESTVAYPCGCTRREIADSSQQGIDGQIYPGTCRQGLPSGRSARAWRVRTGDYPVGFSDVLHGFLSQNLQQEIGDFVVKRADGLYAYQLAVVVDDAFQGITQVVRGSDLQLSTPRQIYLQRLLQLASPHYMHLPVALNSAGEKLGKQTRAPAVTTDQIVQTLYGILQFLHQQPPVELLQGSAAEVLAWAVKHWQLDRLRGAPLQASISRS